MAVPIADLCGGGASWRMAAQKRASMSPPSSPAKGHAEETHEMTTKKRSRPIHDVDGSFTGFLSCKKRRLRRDLITSRLSRPFSLPATHILNRQTTLGGELFLRRAAAVASSLRGPDFTSVALEPGGQPGSIPTRKVRGQGPAEMIHRAAMLNRIRLRVCQEVGGRGKIAVQATESDLPPDQGLPFGSVDVGFLATRPKLSGQRRPEPISLSTAELPDTAAATRNLSPQAAHQKPLRNPELRARRGLASRSTEEDQGDEDSLSFPNSNYIEDLADMEDVYADFGVIFGGAAEKDEGVSENELVTGTLHAAEHLEEYMDDLDGIPAAAR